jgi:hypothetical protein
MAPVRDAALKTAARSARLIILDIVGNMGLREIVD